MTEEEIARLRQDSELLHHADQFRESVLGRADIKLPYPAWHGWVIVDAWIAGHEAARMTLTQEFAEVREAARAALSVLRDRLDGTADEHLVDRLQAAVEGGVR